ncbi:MAG: hypothetical protein HY954_08365 [Deltaproteobacteria bacterium]|nr:hypothetical protein [Deltaproteobacteria bacterium]
MAQDKSIFDKIIPLVVLSVLALIYISPVLAGIHNIGVSDWDNQLFYNGAALKTILTYRQFPLWNPYNCGGSPMLASPELSFLSPAYIFVLFFGEVAGVKLIIVFFTVLGMWGMYFLSRTLGLGRWSSYLPPVVYIISSWYALRITEGHSGFLPFALLPFVIAFYVRSIEGQGVKNLVLSGFFWAWMILAGGVYPTTVTAIFLFFFSMFQIISKRSVRPAVNLFIIAVVTFGLSAVKTLPQYEFISYFPRKTATIQYNSGTILKDSLFKRDQRVTAQDASFYKGLDEDQGEYLKSFWRGERPWGWQEYGAFIGISAFLLYLAGFALIRRIWVWLSLSIISLLLSMGDFAPLNIWSYLRRLPVFSSLHGPSRIATIFIFTAAVIAGFSLSGLEGRGKKRWGGIIAIVAVAIVFLEMITVSRPVLKEAFTEPPYNITENKDFYHIVAIDPTRTNYPNFLKNTGVANCYESMHPPTSVSPYGDELGRVNPDYTGEVYLLGGGSATLRYFSPNKMIIDVDAPSADRLVLNQNYFTGWNAKGVDGVKAAPYKGLVSAEVPPGKNEITFYYSPLSFKIGLVISIISLIVSLVIVILPSGRKCGV